MRECRVEFVGSPINYDDGQFAIDYADRVNKVLDRLTARLDVVAIHDVRVVNDDWMMIIYELKPIEKRRID